MVLTVSLESAPSTQLPFFSFHSMSDLYCVFQMDLSDLDLETLAPYIPMDGEDFQLNPICPEDTPSEATGLGAVQQSFSNIASLFQPLNPPPGHFQSNQSGEKQRTSGGSVGPWPAMAYGGPIQIPPYHDPACTPLSSMGGRQNLQWPPDPLLNYTNAKSGMIDSLLANRSCQAVPLSQMPLNRQR